MTVDLLNVVGIGLILLYVFTHIQQKRTDDPDIEREWRYRSSGVLVGFAFYAVVVATWGPSETWVATVGTMITGNIEEFATQVVLLGEPDPATGPIDRTFDIVRIIGLVAYVAILVVLSLSGSAVSNVGRFIQNRV